MRQTSEEKPLEEKKLLITGDSTAQVQMLIFCSMRRTIKVRKSL